MEKAQQKLDFFDSLSCCPKRRQLFCDILPFLFPGCEFFMTILPAELTFRDSWYIM